MQKATSIIERKPVLSQLKKSVEDYLFMAPFLMIFFIFTVIPVVISIFLSFTYFNVLQSPKFNGLSNYFNLFLDNELFILSLKNTVLLSVITGPISFFISLIVAWALNEFSGKVRTVLTLMFYAPSLSGTVYLTWQLIYSQDSYGLLNGFLLSLNIIYEPIQWLTDARYMIGGAIVVILWMSLGTGFLSLIAGLQTVDKSLYEAAAVDGVKNRWQELWFVTLPAIKPQLMFAAVMNITASFGIGDVITGIYGFPSTNYKLNTIVHMLQDYGGIRFEMGYASAIATILFVIMLSLNKVVQNLIKKVGQ